MIGNWFSNWVQPWGWSMTNGHPGHGVMRSWSWSQSGSRKSSKFLSGSGMVLETFDKCHTCAYITHHLILFTPLLVWLSKFGRWNPLCLVRIRGGRVAGGGRVMDKDGGVAGRAGERVNTSGRTESTPSPPTKKARQRGFVAIFTHLLFPPLSHLCAQPVDPHV